VIGRGNENGTKKKRQPLLNAHSAPRGWRKNAHHLHDADMAC